jgi:N-acetylmuramoyl-L-alanine amidase
MNPIERLMAHCSDSEWGTREIVRGWHLERGWADIGYNAIILNGYPTSKGPYIPEQDGLLVMGRGLDFSNAIDPSEVGAHALGYNRTSIGVCLIGVSSFSLKQFRTLYHFCKLWEDIVPGIIIGGHYEVDARKTCPNFDMHKFRDLLLLEEPPLQLFECL